MRRRAAVLGSPISHSLSPTLHRAAYAELDLDWSYDAIEVGDGDLVSFVDGLDHGAWAGLSVTMPLKAEAFALARMRSDTVARTRAANTLIPLGAGWSAENTDVPGLVAALDEAGVDLVERACVIGAGATAASAVLALTRRGVRRVEVVARRPERVDALADVVAGLDVELRPVAWADAESALAHPLVVCTVPAGAGDSLAGVVPAQPGVLFDVVYDPWPTVLGAAWTTGGGRVLGGLDLLVHQAVLQVELMSGRRPAVATLRAAGQAALASRRA